MIRGIAQIEEVNRILEVLTSIGVQATWSNDGADLELIRPARAATSRRWTSTPPGGPASVIMFLGPLLHSYDNFELPVRRRLRPRRPHHRAAPAGAAPLRSRRRRRPTASTTCTVDRSVEPDRPITLTERGDTVTENALLAAALSPGVTVLRNASPNYMVQDLCVFLTQLGVEIDGHRHHHAARPRRCEQINTDVEFAPSEDPIEAMSLITAAIVTESELTIERAPIEFLEIELAILDEMGLDFTLSDGVRRRQRPHPAGRPDRPAVAAARRRSTRSTRCRSPA